MQIGRRNFRNGMSNLENKKRERGLTSRAGGVSRARPMARLLTPGWRLYICRWLKKGTEDEHALRNGYRSWWNGD